MRNYVFTLLLAATSLGFGADRINYSQLKGHETVFAEAVAAAEKACPIKNKEGRKLIQSSPLAFNLVHGKDNKLLVLEIVLIGMEILESDHHPSSWRLIVVSRNTGAFNSQWQASILDEVNFNGVSWLKNSITSDTGFDQKMIEKFWQDWRAAATATDTETLLDWLFLDNVKSFSKS